MPKTNKVRHEELYMKFCSIEKVEPTEEGKRQFVLFTSTGIEPEEPDPYYICLQCGKRWFNWQMNEMKDSYYSGLYRTWEHSNPWPGWYSLMVDWQDEHWVLKELFSWLDERDKPDWLVKAKKEQKCTILNEEQK